MEVAQSLEGLENLLETANIGEEITIPIEEYLAHPKTLLTRRFHIICQLQLHLPILQLLSFWSHLVTLK